MRALAVILLLLGWLRGGPTPLLAAQYRSARIATDQTRGMEFLQMGSLLPSLVRARRAAPTPAGLSSTYLGADLPNGDEQIMYNSATGQFVNTVMDTTQPTTTRDVVCTTTSQLTTAINPTNLQAGDCIKLTAGTRYTGDLSNWGTISAWAVIETAGMTGLPSPGTRATTAHAANMAIIETNSGLNGYIATGLTGGKGWIWFRGVKFECNSGTATTDVMVRLGDLNPTSPSHLATHVVFDRILVNVDPATNGVKKFVRADAHYVAIIDSTIREIFHAWNNPDSHIIANSNSNGPVKLVNNELNGASQSLLTGGAGYTGGVTPTGERPADWEVRRNWLTKSVARKGVFYNPGGTGSFEYTVKTCCEFKDMERALVTGNYMQYSWVSGQDGWGFSFTNYSIGGQDERLRDLVYAYNKMSDIGSGVQQYQENSNTPTRHERIVITHLMLYDFHTAPTTGNGRQFIATGTQKGKLTLRHWTCYTPTAVHALMADRQGNPFVWSELDAQRLIMHRGTPDAYGFWSDNGVGTAGLNVAAQTWTFQWNLLVGVTGGTYPANNVVGAVAADCYTDGANDDLTLPASPYGSSSYYGGAPGPGADVPEVLARTAGCVTGVWT